MIFTRTRLGRKPSSTLALAIALATTSAVAATAIEAPAYAQKKKKGDAQQAEKNYSKEFIAVYQPLAKQVEEGADVTTLQGQIPALTGAIQTPDDRYVAGNMILQMGQKGEDPALQRQGLEMMLQSGKVPAESLGQYNMIAGQIAYNAKDFAAARQYMETAVANGYTQNAPQALIAETYFQEENYADGLTYLTQAIEARQAAGQPVDQQWIKRGLSISYNNQLSSQASDYARMLVANEPTPANWADVVAIQLNGTRYENPELLDLMRLAREADALRDEGFYADYVDAADYRKLPGEVVAVIDEGKASGKIDQSSQFLNDIRGQAVSRAQTDRNDLPGILSNARSASDVSTIVSGADLALSYGEYAAAEELYMKALDMPGADTALVHTRLGIAQLELGKTAEAKSHFDAVSSGARAPIAKLWSVYADQQGGM